MATDYELPEPGTNFRFIPDGKVYLHIGYPVNEVVEVEHITGTTTGPAEADDDGRYGAEMAVTEISGTPVNYSAIRTMRLLTRAAKRLGIETDI